MFIINSEKKDIKIKTTFIKTKTFQMKQLKKDEILIEFLVEKSINADGADLLVDMIEYFQYIEDGEEKLKKQEIEEILDVLFEQKKYTIFDLYKEFMKEFDCSGVIPKEMGFTMAKKLDEKMTEMLETMDKMDKKEQIQQNQNTTI